MLYPMRLAVVVGALAGAARAQTTFVAPDDPNLQYLGVVNSTIDGVRAHFDRLPVMAAGGMHSPGVRIEFVCDAKRINVCLDYLGTFATSGAGHFRLEVDGSLDPASFGSDVDLGINSYVVFQQSTAKAHTFSLIWPFASNVDFMGLEISGGSPGLVGPPSAAPQFLHVAYGDSITHGFSATSIAEGYPYQVACSRGWSSINVGFFGQNVDPADGALVGSLGGDLVTLAIGLNDWFFNTPSANFGANYTAMLDNIRVQQPDVRIIAMTPIWSDREGLVNMAGMTVEGYRQEIRDVVLQRTANDPQLYLMEGSVLVPPDVMYFADGVHPNDIGFMCYADALSNPNIAVEPGFEQDGFAWIDLGASMIETSSPNSGTAALRIGPGIGGAEQPLGRVQRGLSYRLSAWAYVDRLGATGTVAVVFYDDQRIELERASFQVTAATYAYHSVLVDAPPQFAEARILCEQVGGAAFLWVDDLELIDVGAIPPKAYCTAKTNSLGCVPSIGFAGASSTTQALPFDVLASNVLNQRNGLLFYGYDSALIAPFNGGTLCVFPPLRRLPIQSAGGSLPPTMDCTGTYNFDFNAHTQSGVDPFLVPGRQVNAQWWSRDPQHVDGIGVGLTDAIEFVIGN